jgi:hypothetical protein
MGALAAMMEPGSEPSLLSRAIQLTAVLASDMAAAAEFASRGGVIGLMALVSDSKDKEVRARSSREPCSSSASCTCLQAHMSVKRPGLCSVLHRPHGAFV